jgi:hypothetical protein
MQQCAEIRFSEGVAVGESAGLKDGVAATIVVESLAVLLLLFVWAVAYHVAKGTK